MGALREFFKKNPIAGWAVVVLLVALAGYMAAGRLFGGGAPARVAAPAPPAPPTVATPAPPPVPTPAPAPVIPKVAAPKVVPSGPTGRGDPFVPLVKPPSVAGGPPPPPSGTLPPPPFPVPPPPPGPGLPPPPLPGGPQPPATAGGIALTGIIGNTSAVAIISIGGRTEIVAEGESVGDLKVLDIDAVRRTVTFLRAGRRFEVSMGGE